MAVGYFGQNFAQGFTTGFFNSPGLKDYQHASDTFRSNGYELSPRNKFLYHVFFNINTGQIKSLQNVYGSDEIATISLLVKSVDLPSYQISVDTMNQYNRKRLVQSKIEYNPINLVFHDDQSDIIRNMWYNYYTYYYKDASQPYENVPAYNGTLGNLQTLFNGFGYNTRDTYSYAEGGATMQNQMTIRYETVKYYSGAIGGATPSVTVPGFADPTHYDLTRSGLARPGSTQTVFGQGGLVDAGIGIINDLQRGDLNGVIGAVQTAGTAYNTFKGKSISSIANQDAQLAAAQIAQYSLPGYTRAALGGNGLGQFFPTPPRTATQVPIGQVGFLPNGQGGT